MYICPICGCTFIILEIANKTIVGITPFNTSDIKGVFIGKKVENK